MMLLKPTISISRVILFKENRTVFDAKFHAGVNIIRGHNSSGKTTILDIISYALGAENIPWREEALLCDYAIAEVVLNNVPTTLRREINDKPLNQLFIYWGSVADALAAPVNKWEVYPFRRSSNRISFTQALLLALELPEAQGDGASNLTMHQFLRVLYADQPSLHSPIFRLDTFDSALNRETVGNYLCGIYDDKLYLAQLQKRDVEKEIQQLDAELRSIFKVLAKSEQAPNVEFLGQAILVAEARRGELLNELTRLKTERTVSKVAAVKNSDTKVRAELDTVKKSLFEAQDALSHKEFEYSDSERFVNELVSRLASLDESQVTRNYFGSLVFSFCPCCLKEVKPLPKDAGLCNLCKNVYGDSAGDTQILRMRNELRIQLQESKSIISQLGNEITKLRGDIPLLRQNLSRLERAYKNSSQIWSTDLENAVEISSRQIGSLDQEIKGLYENQRLAGAIRDLQKRRDDLVGDLAQLNSTIESLKYSQEERKNRVALEIGLTLGRLLRQDLHRQVQFRSAQNIQFSFADNSISVEGATQFSESSTVVLRHLFHLSLLSASTRISDMRLPRLLILDGIEDGGMELERSYRLQEIIVNECLTFKTDYQLIFATSQIAPQLDSEKFVVGRYFSEEARSLQI